MRKHFVIARRRQVGGHLQSPGAFSDARGQHFLLVADQRVKFSFGNAGATRDLKCARRGIATLHERREGGGKNAPAHG